MNNRFTNPFFWIGLLGVLFSAAGISVESLTSWEILLDSLMSIISNPFLLVSVVAAVTGIFVDPTTKGLKDTKDKE